MNAHIVPSCGVSRRTTNVWATPATTTPVAARRLPRPVRLLEQAKPVERTEGHTLKDIERAHVERTLRETEGNLSKAAKILAIDRGTLYSKMRRYGLK
jgi:transcriptional regulator of acetoin/glycerol metabolism